jgi:hypothetical protein
VFYTFRLSFLGYWRLLDIDYIGGFLDYLIPLINQNGWSIDYLNLEDCIFQFEDEKDYPTYITRHLLESFTEKQSGKDEKKKVNGSIIIIQN